MAKRKRVPTQPAPAVATPAKHARAWNVPAATLAAADVLHGWTLHEHHAGAPLEITEDAFLDAIAAVDSNPPVPAEGACSPHRHRRL